MTANNGTDYCMLTTTDNPYDPRDDFDRWFVFDENKGHNTCGLLARIAKVPDSFPQNEKDEAIEKAIDFIVSHDLEGIYVKKVYSSAVSDAKNDTEAAK